MNGIKIFSLLCVVVSFISCASRTGQQETVYFEDEALSSSYKVLNTELLNNSHKILAIPFRPGKGVESNEKLDAISLMIIKGLHDSFKDSGGHYKVLSADESEDAELILRGYIVKMQAPKKGWKSWFVFKKPLILAIDVTLLHQKSGQTVAVFKQVRESREKNLDLKYLAHFLGQDIGNIIGSEIQKK